MNDKSLGAPRNINGQPDIHQPDTDSPVQHKDTPVCMTHSHAPHGDLTRGHMGEADLPHYLTTYAHKHAGIGASMTRQEVHLGPAYIGTRLSAWHSLATCGGLTVQPPPLGTVFATYANS